MHLTEFIFDILEFVVDSFHDNWPKRLWTFVTKCIPRFFSDLRKGLIWAQWKSQPAADIVLHALAIFGLFVCEAICILLIIANWFPVIAAIVGLLLILPIVYFMIPPTESEDK